MTFLEGLHNRANEVHDILDDYFVDGINHFETHINDAMRYSLLSGGKRIRPVILMEISKMLGVEKQKVIPFAVALEMIHTYSLIHDDLPAMDDDDLRRGKPTNHKIYGEAMAILAGDALLNGAYELLAQQIESPGEIKAMAHLSKAAGRKGMIGGQVADIMLEGKEGTKEYLSYIHLNKTGALLTAAFVIPALIKEVEPDTIDKLTTIGNNIGLIFQIKDDILDLESTEEELGKPIGSDEKNNKLTYPNLYGLDVSKEHLIDLIQETKDTLKYLDYDSSFITDLITYLGDRKN